MIKKQIGLPDDFNAKVYRGQHHDLGKMGEPHVTAHYLRHGNVENRKYDLPVAWFDAARYRDMHTDLSDMKLGEAAMHFWKFGQAENRDFLDDREAIRFNEDIYRLYQPDIVGKGDPWTHFKESIRVREPLETRFQMLRRVDPYHIQDPKTLMHYQQCKGIRDLVVNTTQVRWYPLDFKPIVVVIYTQRLHHTSGGSVALHHLAKKINDLQHPCVEARLFALGSEPYTNPFCERFVRLRDMDRLRSDPSHSYEVIVVYPEVVYGNPLGVDRVIRWMLMDVGVHVSKKVETTWGERDKIFYWEPKSLDGVVDHDARGYSLSCPYVPEVFRTKTFPPPHRVERTLVCYTVRKGDKIRGGPEAVAEKKKSYPIPPDAIRIEWNTSLEDVAKIFKKCYVFYSFDPNCMYSLFAPLCGCASVIVDLPGVAEKEYFESRIFSFRDQCIHPGIMYGKPSPEILQQLRREVTEEYAQTREQILQHLENIGNVLTTEWVHMLVDEYTL